MMPKNILFQDGTYNVTEVDVTSIGFDANTLVQHTFPDGSDRKTERINLDTNELFTWCGSVWDIEDQVEWFWNRPNDLESEWKPREIVKVLQVKRIEE